MLTRRDVLAIPAAAAVTSLPVPFAKAFADDADPTKVFTGDKKPTDARLGAPKTLNDDFPFVVPKSKSRKPSNENAQTFVSTVNLKN